MKFFISVIIIIFFFLHGLGLLICSGIDALPSFPGGVHDLFFFYFSIFRKSVEKIQVSLKSGKNKAGETLSSHDVRIMCPRLNGYFT
jgi:hypothetical protein